MKSMKENEQPLQPRKSRRGLWIVVGVIAIVAIIVVAGALTNWFGLGGPSPIQLNGAGSSFAYPLMSAWSTQYKGLTGVQINYQATGSGAGINAIIAKNLDFGGTDAPLNATQHAQNPTLLTIPESLGAVTVAYNLPGAPAHINLTGPIIANIYLGVIRTWNDLNITTINPGFNFPSTSIFVEYRSDSSGTTFVFTDYLSKVSAQFASQVGKGKLVAWPVGSGAPQNQGVANAVKGQAGAIGYVELAYVVQNSMAYAKIKNAAGNYILPDLNSTAAAAASTAGSLPAGNGDWSKVSITNATGTNSYPIATFTYLLVYQELNIYPSGMTQAKAKALVDFLWWAVHSGQTEAAMLTYAPLPSAVVTLDETTIHTITFNGGALLP
jgi:phosphate transport system substrate-binding protein